jgi:hypothetical protein
MERLRERVWKLWMSLARRARRVTQFSSYIQFERIGVSRFVDSLHEEVFSNYFRQPSVIYPEWSSNTWHRFKFAMRTRKTSESIILNASHELGVLPVPSLFQSYSVGETFFLVVLEGLVEEESLSAGGTNNCRVQRQIVVCYLLKLSWFFQQFHRAPAWASSQLQQFLDLWIDHGKDKELNDTRKVNREKRRWIGKGIEDALENLRSTNYRTDWKSQGQRVEDVGKRDQTEQKKRNPVSL